MTSDTTKLAEGVAGLLPNKMPIAIEKGLKYDGKEYSALAFECHKALSIKLGQCLITRYDDIEEGVGVLYDYTGSAVSGMGYKDEEAIFNAVLDWHEKEGGE